MGKNSYRLATLTIRDIDREVMRWLRTRAAIHERSMNKELLDILRIARADEMAEAAGENPFAASYRRARSRGIRTPSSLSIVREARDRSVREVDENTLTKTKISKKRT